jgi:hypothetical protein
MSERTQRLTAELGCGALILVIIAAFIGASAGMERSRSRTQATVTPTIPSIFREGNLVARMTPSQTVLPRLVYEVVDTEGTWVKLEFDANASLSLLAQMSPPGQENLSPEDREAFFDPEKNPLVASVNMKTGGEWWLNTATTTDLWQKVELEE